MIAFDLLYCILTHIKDTTDDIHGGYPYATHDKRRWRQIVVFDVCISDKTGCCDTGCSNTGCFDTGCCVTDCCVLVSEPFESRTSSAGLKRPIEKYQLNFRFQWPVDGMP